MLNCETCAKTQHHCCKASISYNIMEVLHLSEKADELGIEIKVLPSKEKPNYFNIIKRGKPIKNLNDENCVFLNDGKCKIYEDRPSICKVYGTELVNCWFNDFDHDTPIDKIFDMNEEDVKKLTVKAMDNNEKKVISFFNKKMC